MLEHNLKHIEYSLPHLAELALGGTAVGTGLNTHPERVRVAEELAASPGSRSSRRPKVRSAGDLRCAGPHPRRAERAGGLADENRQRRALAGLGPRCGIGEISIPENEPGSSIMPGKVNPTQCEAMTMLCCQVMGNDVAVNLGGASGNFELNVYRPMVIHNVLQSIRLLADGMESFNEHCAVGLSQIASASASCSMNPDAGDGAQYPYRLRQSRRDRQKAHKEGLTLKASALALGYLTGGVRRLGSPGSDGRQPEIIIPPHTGAAAE
jgi:fumarate hydratase class II